MSFIVPSIDHSWRERIDRSLITSELLGLLGPGALLHHEVDLIVYEADALVLE